MAVGSARRSSEVPLSSNQSNQPVNTRLLISGAVLTGLGGMLATLGLALGSSALVGAARRWQQRTEMTPAQLAKHAYGAAQIARTAGVGAWRDPITAGQSVGARRASADGAGIPVS
ncbi:MAG TPA: hypothetical protein VGH76_25775 [Actinomycetospora sp.]|uniref:hypothetical protein n=1 Tax=Actinomycetospora sp. TaxID=1872135 RepID=UPI002F3E3669